MKPRMREAIYSKGSFSFPELPEGFFYSEIKQIQTTAWLGKNTHKYKCVIQNANEGKEMIFFTIFEEMDGEVRNVSGLLESFRDNGPEEK